MQGGEIKRMALIADGCQQNCFLGERRGDRMIPLFYAGCDFRNPEGSYFWFFQTC